MIGTESMILLADGSSINVPEAEVNISSPYFSGVTVAKCMERPLYDVIIGNVPGARQPMEPDPNWKASSFTSVASKSREMSTTKEDNGSLQVIVGAKISKPCSPVGVRALQLSREMFRTKQQEDTTLQVCRSKIGKIFREKVQPPIRSTWMKACCTDAIKYAQEK